MFSFVTIWQFSHVKLNATWSTSPFIDNLKLCTVIVFSLLFNAIVQVHYKPALPYIILEVITMSNDVAFGISVSLDPLILLPSYEEGFFFYLQHYGALFWTSESLFLCALYSYNETPNGIHRGVVISQQAQ